MKCPECRHENRVLAKFCEECAARLVRSCTKCGSELSATAKFCSECGHAVHPGFVSQANVTSPETFTPKDFTEKILVSNSAPEGIVR